MTGKAEAGTISELRHRHFELLRQWKERPSDSQTVAMTMDFITFAVRSGEGLESAEGRSEVQDLLDHWQLKLLSSSKPGLKLPTGEAIGCLELLQHQSGAQDEISQEARNQERAYAAKEQIRLSALADQWKKAGRDPGYLLDGTALEAAKAYREKDPQIESFVSASEDFVSQRQRATIARLRATIVSLSVLVVSLAGAIGYAISSNRIMHIALADLGIRYDISWLWNSHSFVKELESSRASARDYEKNLRDSLDKTTNLEELAHINTQLEVAKKSKENAETELLEIENKRQEIGKRIKSVNGAIWASVQERERSDVIARVHDELAKGKLVRSSQQQLRIALYAIAAVPESNSQLNIDLADAIESFKERKSVAVIGAKQVWGVAFRPNKGDDEEIALGTDYGTVWLWKNPERSNELVPLPSAVSNNHIVNDLAYNESGSLIAAAYRNSGVAVWDADRQTLVCVINPVDRIQGDGEKDTFAVAFAPKQREKAVLAIAGRSRAYLWEIDANRCDFKGETEPHAGSVFTLNFDPGGEKFATGSGDGKLRFWSIHHLDGRLNPQLSDTLDMDTPIFSVAFSPSGDKVGGATADGRGFIVSINALHAPPVWLERQTGGVGQIAFSRDGKMLIATATAEGGAIISDGEFGRSLYSLDNSLLKAPLFGSAFSNATNYLVTGNLDGRARLWDLNTASTKELDRTEMLNRAFHRLNGDLRLTQSECNALREMRIPILKRQEGHLVGRTKISICDQPLLWTGY